ncbi:hypothetical protein FH972_021429 [Carpinus fangiana]|uniref:Uncharacterized protein n=1 Tax=Carpinus fangiana TaxID=176857 RepID=A0A5N6KPX4_9ROSI|nr:hypothetical protein FH972_021429 [Carpinus fangiana]
MLQDSAARYEHLLAPITALCFASNLILAGEGPFLKVFNKQNYSFLKKLAIFRSQAIHGIIVAGETDVAATLLVYGGPYVCIVVAEKTENKPIFRRGPVTKCSDRVLEIVCRPSETGFLASGVDAIAITAHNALVGLTSRQLSGNVLLESDIQQQVLTAATRCMLYTATLKWLTSEEVMIVAGTALGEIMVWTCRYHAVSQNGVDNLNIHYFFPAHDGSVFGLDVFFHTAERDSCRALVASCSDDRTIRIWDVTPALASGPATNVEDKISDSVLADAPKPVSAGQGMSVQKSFKIAPFCIAKTWAHSSRIWHVRFVSRPSDIPNSSSATIFSFGEDTECQMWTLALHHDNFHESSPAMTRIDAFSGHVGKNIWSFAIAAEGSGTYSVATGGADGCIVIATSANPVGSETSSLISAWTIEDFMQTMPTTSLRNEEPRQLLAIQNKKQKDGFKSYGFVGQGKLLLITQRGAVIRVEVSHPQCSSIVSHASDVESPAITNDETQPDLSRSRLMIESISNEPEVASYAILTGNDELGMAFIGGADGQIFVYNDQSRSLGRLAKLDGKVNGLFSCRPSNNDKSSSHNNLFLLATEMGSQTATLLIVSKTYKPTNDLSPPYRLDKKIWLGAPSNFIVTSFLVTKLGRWNIFLGSRDGRIIRYHWNDHESEEEIDTKLMLSTFHDVGYHSDAVTSMLWRSKPQSEEKGVNDHDKSNFGFLLTTARDFTYSMHKVVFNDADLTSVQVHSTTLPFGPNIEGVYEGKNSSSGDLKFFGFHSKNFVEFSEQSFTELMKIECGGAHRVWAYQPKRHHDVPGGLFLWTKASKLEIFDYSEPQCQIVKAGGHGREIKACMLRPEPYQENCSSRILATGAEDTDIRLFTYSEDSSLEIKAECVSVLRKHNTGIQSLQWSDDGRYLFSCGGCEEFFVWRIRRFSDSFVRIGVVCEAILPPSSELADLRIMSFSVLHSNQQSRESPPSQSEEDMFEIFMVFSDSTMRVSDQKSTSSETND